MNTHRVKQHLLQKIAERQIEKNPEMMEDLLELSRKVVFFNTKWGTNLQAEDVIINQQKEV